MLGPDRGSDSGGTVGGFRVKLKFKFNLMSVTVTVTVTRDCRGVLTRRLTAEQPPQSSGPGDSEPDSETERKMDESESLCSQFKSGPSPAAAPAAAAARCIMIGSGLATGRRRRPWARAGHPMASRRVSLA